MAQAPIVTNEVNDPVFISNNVLSAISDSGIYITGLVNHSVTGILLDTGATVSVLNEETWRKCGHFSKVNPVTGTLTTANGNELTVLGETKVRFRVGNIDCFWAVMIARGLSHDCILGSDFFQHFGCQIHYDTGTFVVGHTEIPIRYCKVTPSVCKIFLNDDIQVEPGTEQVIEAKLENGYDRNTGTPGILEESRELRGKSEINVARSLVVPRDGLTIVRVANFSDRPIRLRPDFPVAEFHPISSVDGRVVSMETDPDFTSTSHPSCSLIDSSVVKDEQPMEDEKWKSLLQGNLEGLSEDQRRQFSSLVTEYEDIFSKDSSDLGKSGLLEHAIDTGDCKPVKQPPRRVPPYQREVIDKQLDELLATGRVEPSQSPWSSPVVLARKHDGTYRMCIDFRKLNQSTKKDAIPLPRTDDLLEALGGAQWFSSLDLASGYWQMQVKEEDRPKTAFSTHRGQFQWTVMPFGLTNGPASFTRLMNLALSGLTWTHCLVYLDDIIIWAPTFEDHIHRLRLVFDRIRAAGLKLKPSKCQFLRKEVVFLGHVVSSDGIKTDPEKVKAVETWPVPLNVKELQSFLGLASYYRKFILGFSIIAEPLYQLCRKTVSFSWQQGQQAAFEELKGRLISAPVLAYPNFSAEAGSFILDTDASQYQGIGAVLSQQQQDGTERVIAYGSRSLNEHEKNYCTTRLEMLALVTYVDYFRYYLLGRRFCVRTDHSSLRWLRSFKEPEGQVARWLERLQEYDFEVQHRPGKQHSNADSLSRRPRRNHGECPSCAPSAKPEVATVTSRLPHGHNDDEKDLWSFENVAQAQSEDPDIGPVVDQLLREWKKPTDEELRPLSRATREIWAQWELLELREGVLYLRSPERGPSAKSRMVLPQKLVKESLMEIHDGLTGAHLGRMKTLKKMKTRFWRPGLTKEVHRYCSSCLTCAKCKPRPRPKAPLHPIPSGNPMQRIHIDIVGPLPRSRRGNRYILTVQCSFTKWAEAYAIPNQRATTCARVLVKNWICRYGVPDSIHSDQGRNFESQVFEEMCHLLNINKTRSTAYHPEGNGQVENLHKTLKSMLKTRVDDDPQRWDEQLDYCMMAFRSSVHSSTEHTPFELMFGREMRIPLDVMMGSGPMGSEDSYSEFVADLQGSLEAAYRDVRQNLKVAQRRQKDAYDKGVRHMLFQPGDLVLRYDPQLKPGEVNKFHRQWEGPYEIVERVTDVTYRVKKVRGHSRKSRVVHFNNLRLYKRRQEGSMEETGAKEAVDAPVGGNGAGEQVQTASEEVVSMEPDIATSGTEEEAVWVAARSEGYNEVVDMPDESASGDPPYLTESASDGEVEQGAGSDHVVDKPAAEGGGLLDDTQGCCRNGEENKEHEQEVEEEQPVGQSQRPARIRRPPDRYGEWILNSLQQITDRLKMLEDKQRQDKERIKKLKPILLKKARALREL